MCQDTFNHWIKEYLANNPVSVNVDFTDTDIMIFDWSNMIVAFSDDYIDQAETQPNITPSGKPYRLAHPNAYSNTRNLVKFKD